MLRPSTRPVAALATALVLLRPAGLRAQAACATATLEAYAALGSVGCRVGGADGVRFSGFGASGSPGGDALRVMLTPFTTTLADGRPLFGFDVRYDGVADATAPAAARGTGGYGFTAAVQAVGTAGVSGGRVTQFAPVLVGATDGGGFASILLPTATATPLFSRVCPLGPPRARCDVELPLDFAPRFDVIGFTSTTFLDVSPGGTVRLDGIRFGFATGVAATTVPEPPAAALVAAGVAALGAVTVRRRRGG